MTLAPDPLRDYESGYQTTNQRAYEIARRRHINDMRKRSADVDDWANYPSRHGERIPWTHRQQLAAVVYLTGCVALVLIGAVSASWLAAGATVAAWPVSWWTIRDLWWRFEITIGTPMPAPLAELRYQIEYWLHTDTEVEQ